MISLPRVGGYAFYDWWLIKLRAGNIYATAYGNYDANVTESIFLMDTNYDKKKQNAKIYRVPDNDKNIAKLNTSCVFFLFFFFFPFFHFFK